MGNIFQSLAIYQHYSSIVSSGCGTPDNSKSSVKFDSLVIGVDHDEISNANANSPVASFFQPCIFSTDNRKR